MSDVPQPLQRLADRVGTAATLGPEAMARGVKSALHAATAESGWLPPERRRASHENYARHLIYADPGNRFSILALVWAMESARTASQPASIASTPEA